ncbi:MAG: NAD-dependent epimerase/dehydratase family protein, partial [Anaerolineae bacterium]|nr:NAD-dependent epimerase/dehydratase family protein [Anaerolineae bacterium]
ARNFDVVVDFVMYNGDEARHMIDILRNHTGHYLFISSGQVYLVREGIERPFTEDEYEGRLQPPPKENTYAYEEWLYGMNKRAAEDAFRTAYAEFDFPYTSLRLPMVNSEYDHFKRLYNYYLRLRDGGPILVPETPSYPLRHVYGGDVVKALLQLVEQDTGIGRAYNISQEETVSLDEFLEILADVMGVAAPSIVRMKRSELDANGFLPDCSPFSERWMSELDNTRSKQELGMVYTPLPEYLKNLVTHYDAHKPKKPTSYNRRSAELSEAIRTVE